MTSLINYYSRAKYRRLRKIYVATCIVCPSLGALVDRVLHLRIPMVSRRPGISATSTLLKLMYVWSSHVHLKDCTSVISLSWRNSIILIRVPISILWGLKVLKVSFYIDFTPSEFGLFIVRGIMVPSAMDSLYKGTAYDTRPPVISGFSTGGYWSDTWKKNLVGKRNP